MKFAPGTKDSITGKPYFYRSECGRYTVTIPHSEPLRYGAWRVVSRIVEKTGKRERSHAVPLGYHDSAAAAKRVCEEDSCRSVSAS